MTPHDHHKLVVHDLTVCYRDIPAVEHVSLELCCGHCVGLVGPNGAGKSTLLKAISGLVPVAAGSVELHGMVPSRTRSIAYLPQRGEIDWDFPVTVQGMVEMGRFPTLGGWRSFSGHDRRVVAEALDLTGLGNLAERQIRELSGGQQQRAFLARAYAQQAHVCLLDEPFAGLDANSQEDLRGILRQMASDGKLVLVTYHDLASVEQVFDEVVLLNRRLVANGAVQDVFNAENIERTFGAAHHASGRSV